MTMPKMLMWLECVDDIWMTKVLIPLTGPRVPYTVKKKMTVNLMVKD